ncbi:SRPBCC family protein [Flavobacterium sp. 5]|uniref:SRPBCC family protein n=1 Tax=Flavobacterium sp. 5 TaxID=2035199 RepID=UPI000C2B6FF5|nr:SRPBCC family protein [Flavobacterium sp. 5]PKB15386.1 polyketide cyclase/dehydrase/lipid transport protein [Flavobacterium sp. 5]
MRIIKYLFLLLLLSLVALTIYIATQKGNFTVESSKVINSPKATVFNYVNDYKNWPKFSSWISNDTSIKSSFSPSTIGKGSSFTWEGSAIGSIQTLYTKENDSIVQKMEFNETSSDVYWSFKDTIGGTKVTWKSVGKMDFMLKVSSFFNVGAKNTLSKVYDKSLANLDKTLDFENSTYSAKINGIVKKLETYYLRQSFTSKISDISRNANVVFPKIIAFCKQNNIKMNGRPFIIYQTYDTIKDLTRASFCIPITEQIFTSDGSDILSGKLEAFEALKTSLTGNYTYKNKALGETTAYTTTKNILTGSTFSHLEIFTRGKNETLSPSKWLTEMYFPIKPKVIPPVYKRVVRDTLAPKPTVKKHEDEFDF